MYRQYENPYLLQKSLNQQKEIYRNLIEAMADEEILFRVHEEIQYLEERINFAWADDEAC